MNNRIQLRQTIRARRQALSINEQDAAGAKLLHNLQSHTKVKSANRLAIYLSNDGELTTQPFISWCWQQKIDVYLPVIHPFSSGHLLFLRYDATTRLISNSYGILEPKLDITKVCSISELDLIFTPLVAFDKTGSRLGMGGGFYDRSLENWQDIDTYPIGLAHDCQLVEKVPTESWDIPLPEIITPSKVFSFTK